MQLSADNIAVVAGIISCIGPVLWAAVLYGMLKEKVNNISTGLKGVQKDVKEILLMIAKDKGYRK